jgi:hypothetical protein
MSSIFHVDIRKKGKKALVSTETIVNNLTPKNFHFKSANKSMMSLLANDQQKTFQMQFMEANGISGCLVPNS